MGFFIWWSQGYPNLVLKGCNPTGINVLLVKKKYLQVAQRENPAGLQPPRTIYQYLTLGLNI